ncbi:MAG: Protoporphyrinogen IX oxidase, aerobic, HemY, partial [uncultured Quadrisphaera sp.]
MSGTVVVVGGGVTGLATAWALARAPGERSVVLLEAGGRTGGALAPVRLDLPGGPLVLDGGSESLLARRPEAVALAAEVGLGDDLVSPTTARAAVLSRGALHPLPAGTLLGVPGDPAALRGLLTDEEVARASAEVLGGPVHGDVDVAGWVAGRLGPAVVDRLVEPLLGGVYAGSATGTSLRAALAPLAVAASAGTSVLDAVAAAVGGPGGGPGGARAGGP